MARKQETRRTFSVVGSATAPSHAVFLGNTTGVSEKISYMPALPRERVVQDKIAKRAVYNHLRFLRSLGRTVVGTDEVARALSLPITQVERIAITLHPKGVKLEW